MDREAAEYVNLPYVTEVVPEEATDGTLCYRAVNPELPGCMSHGITPEEAIENLSEARQLYIDILLKKGESIPMPQLSKLVSGSPYQTVVWSVMGSSVTGERAEITNTLPEEASPISQLVG